MKNPFMSMWLSAANAAIGKAHGHASSAVSRETHKAISTSVASGMKQMMAFWTPLTPPKAVAKRRGRRRK
jgi:hypothetical protein